MDTRASPNGFLGMIGGWQNAMVWVREWAASVRGDRSGLLGCEGEGGCSIGHLAADGKMVSSTGHQFLTR